MKPKYLLVVSAVVAGISGLLFILFPGQALAMTGVMGAGLIGQILGAAGIGIAVLNFFSRNLEEGEALRAVLLANFVSSGLDFLLCVIFAFTSGLNPFGWVYAVIFLVFGLGFGYFLFFTPSGRLASARR